MMAACLVRVIGTEPIRILRQKLLRQNATLDQLRYAGDDDPNSLHVGAFTADGWHVGIASVYQQEAEGEKAPHLPAAPVEKIWRLRGMATEPDVRGTGCGGALLKACFGHIAARGGTLLWCDARITAVGFYEHYGFVKAGYSYNVTDVGPHELMWRAISEDDRRFIELLNK